MKKNISQKFKKNNSGVSLMETVVYVSLTALLSLMVVQTLLSLGKTFRAVKVTRDIENSALVSLDRMAKEIRLANSVDGGSVFGTTTSPGKLILAYSGVSTTTREFSVDADGILRLVENGADRGGLTSPNVSVKTFWVEQATTTGKTTIRVTLVLEDKIEKTNPAKATFYTAAAMRNLY